MLFQLPIDADSTVLDQGIYVDELKRVNQIDLEKWMFSGNTEIDKLKIPHTFTHTGLTPSMLLKWIANYGLALADIDDEFYRKVTDELDRRLYVMRQAHFDHLFPRNAKDHSVFPFGDGVLSPLSFDFHVVDEQWKLTVWDETTNKSNTINVHEW